MVHALQLIHRLLRRNGVLINVFDLPTPHVVEVRSPDNVVKVGWLTDRDDAASTRSALNALAQVVADRLFILENQRDFDYNIYVDDLDELQGWLAEWWESAVLADTIIQRLDELTRVAGEPAQIVLALRARMTKLRAI